MGILDFLKGNKKKDQPVQDSPEQDDKPVIAEVSPPKAASKPKRKSVSKAKPKLKLESKPKSELKSKPEIAPVDVAPPMEDTPVGDVSPELETAAIAETAPATEVPVESASKKSWFGRLKDGLGKSADKITSSLVEAVGKPKLDASDLDDIEDALIMADLGVAAAGRLTEGLKKRAFPDGVTQDSLAEALAEEVAEILTPVARPLEINPALKPHVILMVGVNGSGKTTTAGKLAEQWQSQGKKVMMAAADTFRAAAVEQLKIWGERTGTTVISGEPDLDAAAVAYQAYEQAIADGADVLIIDTAGRLHAKAELMEELAKICRVVAKKDDTAPHDRVIVLDGTVGQNATSQVSAFKETADLTGMIITKLDGSARGGIVVSLAESFALPIHAVGVGEGKDDLKSFDAVDFGRALAGLGVAE